MQGAKEFYQYCIEHPEVMERLSALDQQAMSKEIYDMGYSFTKEEFRAFADMGEQESDEMLAAATSGGFCTGHCGYTCERDCAHGGASLS